MSNAEWSALKLYIYIYKQQKQMQQVLLVYIYAHTHNENILGKRGYQLESRKVQEGFMRKEKGLEEGKGWK